jgi:NADPH2:quinone reductase
LLGSLIEVQCTSCNPKDWKIATGTLMTISSCPNSGDDIAGIVVAVGAAVRDFKPGDRVAALHELGTKHGSYAEYAIAYSWTAFHLADCTSFEEACTVPMATFMAAIGLFAMLRISVGPWDTGRERPLLVYGAASAVGAAVVRLAEIVGVHPLICVAGRGISFVERLIDRERGDVVDYRNGPESVLREVREVLGGRKLEFVFDAISEKGSQDNYCPAVDPDHGKVTFVLGGHREDIPPGIEQSTTMAGSLWKELTPLGERDRLGMGVAGRDFGFAYSRLIGNWLQEKRLKAHPFEVVDGGLCGLESALKELRGGKSSAMKFVVRIADTPI